MKSVDRSPILFTRVVPLFVLAAASFDLLENHWLRQLIAWQVPYESFDNVILLIRSASISKFILFAVVLGVECAGLIDGIRIAWCRRYGPWSIPSQHAPFEELYKREIRGAGLAMDASWQRVDAVVTEPGTADEPWVVYAADDRVGLALSGGGIRSATFNLGILQGLFDLNVLPFVDYLSTVSGGGYIGGWWTAWINRRGTARRSQLLPLGSRHAKPGDMPETREADEVRHLREFSMFLSPRWGLLEVEMWNGLVAVLSGTVVALSVACCVASLVLGSWLLLVFALWSGGPYMGAAIFALITASFLLSFEIWWVSLKQVEPQKVNLSQVFGISVLVFVPTAISGALLVGDGNASDAQRLVTPANALVWRNRFRAYGRATS